MGTIKQGILGGFSGKVGTVIGSFWKGRNVMRAIAPHVHDPRTAAQLAHRARFALVSQFVSACQTFINSGFSNRTNRITALNAAVSDNLTNGCVQGTGTAVSLDYTRVALSSGSHINPASPSVTQGTGSTLDLAWVNNANVSPEVRADDIVMVCLYNADRNASTYDLSTSTRADAALNIAYPALWSGETVHVFLVTRSANGRLIAPTLYVGYVTAA